MIIKNNKDNSVLPFNSIFIEKDFKHYPSDTWTDVSAEAAEWLYHVWQTSFDDKQIYLFYSPCSMIDNRINRYKLNKGVINYRNFSKDMIVCMEGDKVVDKKIVYWKIFLLNKNSLSTVVTDFRGNDTDVSIFFGSEENIRNFPLEELLKKRHNKEYRKTHKETEIDIFLKNKMIPIRLGGVFDDSGLCCQIFV